MRDPMVSRVAGMPPRPKDSLQPHPPVILLLHENIDAISKDKDYLLKKLTRMVRLQFIQILQRRAYKVTNYAFSFKIQTQSRKEKFIVINMIHVISIIYIK